MNAARGIIAVALAAALAGPLAGCGTARLFTGFDVTESPEVTGAPWPRLVDTPEAPPPGSYSEDVPDPAVGVSTVVELSEAARRAEARAEALAPPVLSDAERRRLGRP